MFSWATGGHCRDQFIETVVAQSTSAKQAVDKLCTDSRPVVRRQMYQFLAVAVDSLSEVEITRSWDNSGISRALWQSVPKHAPAVDELCDHIPYDICECGVATRRVCDLCEEALCPACGEDHRLHCAKSQEVEYVESD